jgi:hypothetical protein
VTCTSLRVPAILIDQCHLCERGNRVPYFLKCFRDLCVNGQKGLRLLLVTRVGWGGRMNNPLFFCVGCILVVCLLLYIRKKKFLLTELLVFLSLGKSSSHASANYNFVRLSVCL